jgi:hypothetical protein
MTGRCPTPSKARYGTRGAAARAARALLRAGVWTKARPYRCECRAWHLTSHL